MPARPPVDVRVIAAVREAVVETEREASRHNLGLRQREQRREGDVTHFITLTFWESLDAIRAFAGDDVEKAKYYPEDAGFLLEYEPRVVHYEVVGKS